MNKERIPRKMEGGAPTIRCETLGELVTQLPVLGRGNFGVVYKLDNNTALKVIASEFSVEFIHEVQISMQLNASRITPRVYSAGSCDNTMFMVMEYLHGQNFEEYIARYSAQGVIPLHFLRWFVPRLMTKLDRLHQHGIQHNDLTNLQNVFITQTPYGGYPNDVYLLDMGTASVIQPGVMNRDFDDIVSILVRFYNVSPELIGQLSHRAINYTYLAELEEQQYDF